MIRLTPGPCTTSEAVRHAAALPDLNHREPEYEAIAHRTREALRRLGQGFDPRLIGGSGTAAMEAMLTSCVAAGPVLILANGYYSERLDAILQVHGIPHQTLRFDWLSPWNLEEVQRALAERPFEAVVATHHETTTGRLNPVSELVEIASRTGTRVLVDAISSLGGDPLAFNGLHAVCGSANKCLHGIPGVSFVLLEPEFAKEIEGFPRRTYYLSLPMYADESPPLTPPVPAMRALDVALQEMDAEDGLDGRIARYRRQASTIRDALTAKGYDLPVLWNAASHTLTMAPIPPGFSADEWLTRERERGYLLYGCKGALRDRYYQVSTMGQVSDDDVVAWLAGVPPA